jgi:hypothetical protein
MASLVETEERVEKGRAALRTPADHVAYWLSQLTSPFLVGLGVLGTISLATAATMTQGLQWLAVIGVGLLVPFGVIWWRVNKGQLTDLHVSRRSQRLFPLLLGPLALGGCWPGCSCCPLRGHCWQPW